MAKRKRSVRGGGSVYQRKGDGRWVASFIVEDTGKRKELYAKTEKEAIAKLQQALLEQKQGTFVAGPQQTVGQFLEYWLEDVHKTKIRLATYESYRNILNNHLLPALGHIRLQRLTAQHIQSLYAKKQKEGLSPTSIGVTHAVLHRALDHAKRIKLVGSNVCDDVELPKREVHEIQPLTPEQALMLLQKVREHHLEMLLTLALATGMRRGELLGLRWQDIDLEEGSLQVRRTLSYIAHHGFKEGEPKTAKSRRKIALPQFVMDLLKRHRMLQLEARLKAGTAWVDRDLVFPNEHGDFLLPMTLFYQFSRLLKEIGLPHMRFHDLRHSAATLLLSMGVPMKVVQELLGHSNFSTTANVYSHVLLSMQQEAMNKLDDFFRRLS